MAAVTGDITQTTTTGNNTTTTTSGNISLTTSSGNISAITNTGDIDIKNSEGGNINIWSSYTSGTSNISISAGISSGIGSIDIRSRLLDTTINATDADVVIKNNDKTRIQFIGGTALPAGRIMIGGGTSPVGTTTYTVYRPLIVIDSAEVFMSPPFPTDTMHVGISPTVGVPNINPQGPGYNGGGEIIGPYAVPVPVSPSPSFSPWQKENQGTLHIRSNVVKGTFINGPGGNSNNNQTTLPGSLWMYPTIPTQTDDDLSSAYNGENINANVRLWSTPKPKYLSGSSITAGTFYGTSGITIGLNAMQLSAITPITDYGVGGTPVSGRVHLYGQRALDNNGDGSPLDQNVPPSGGWRTKRLAGGVNIGDQWRGRQAFKVWGDYVGHYYVSEFGGAVSGNADPDTRVEQQCFMSGAQGWSSGWVDNRGSMDSQKADAAQFKYKYQWQRVGRVVTGSGMIKTQVSLLGGSAQGGARKAVPSSELVVWGGSSYGNEANNFAVIIGPMDLPMQVGDANTTDGGSPGALAGVNSTNISGTVAMVLDGQTSQSLTANPINSPNSVNPYVLVNTLPSGIVGGGTASDMTDADVDPDVVSTAMWLKVYTIPQLSAVSAGAITSYLKFTFSYEVNPGN
jgi:hypothetical protein